MTSLASEVRPAGIRPAGIQPAGLAFDALAEDYDASFTRSQIGLAQREAVWRLAVAIFKQDAALLELNCGTGEDALFLARQGHSITALDASPQMIARASARLQHEAPDASIHFQLLPTEQLHFLPCVPRFDGIFSNFSGLNCVEDLSEAARQLALRTEPGAAAVLVFSTRFCLWEAIWYSLQGQTQKARRRWSGRSQATLNGIVIPIYYPTVEEIQDAFEPHFELRSRCGIGIFVPPSYMEGWMSRHPRLLKLFRQLDRVICQLPLFRSIGDHKLLHLVRVSSCEASR